MVEIILIWVAICLTNNLSETPQPEKIGIIKQKDLIVMDYNMSREDVYYLAQCVQAESGNQDELGRAYVTDCILNRYDSGNYDSIRDVINAPGQFSVVSNGTINCNPTFETMQIVENELSNKQDDEILYFQTGGYHSFATPSFKYGAHYFSH